jgi:hypothetical protein
VPTHSAAFNTTQFLLDNPYSPPQSYDSMSLRELSRTLIRYRARSILIGLSFTERLRLAHLLYQLYFALDLHDNFDPTWPQIGPLPVLGIYFTSSSPCDAIDHPKFAALLSLSSDLSSLY